MHNNTDKLLFFLFPREYSIREQMYSVPCTLCICIYMYIYRRESLARESNRRETFVQNASRKKPSQRERNLKLPRRSNRRAPDVKNSLLSRLVGEVIYRVIIFITISLNETYCLAILKLFYSSFNR